MRYLALDIGHKYIGLAVSDEMGIIAQALTTIIRDNPEKKDKSLEEIRTSREVLEIEKIAKYYKVGALVLGLAIKQDGSLGQSAQMAKDLGRVLEDKLGLRVIYQDERYSTKSAENILISANMSRKDRKNNIDKLAAVFILQAYLDSI